MLCIDRDGSGKGRKMGFNIICVWFMYLAMGRNFSLVAMWEGDLVIYVSNGKRSMLVLSH